MYYYMLIQKDDSLKRFDLPSPNTITQIQMNAAEKRPILFCKNDTQ
ncbi:Unannotated [Lentimonas sp. CC19]|nr:Unannotated [Lentimonas sp. CC4]CAA6684323.1 Unannotated [Lentimonas sp. CC6]CAA6692129.1 Unannotated [Lentimonas sp. CC19]CAA6694487.1 Unannotated [Lentimonas sp. CC10]CAA7070618.1 Unannotated [Lentimonas sp. CC11]CAA7168324.1 Unannotated [Lentimonas sp. CC21]CAA7181843.1 Unannotated [Lentimonas sp. CC8]